MYRSQKKKKGKECLQFKDRLVKSNHVPGTQEYSSKISKLHDKDPLSFQTDRKTWVFFIIWF